MVKYTCPDCDKLGGNKMSTPPEHKRLWENCTWKTHEERLAFFNHYFKNSKMVADCMKDRISGLKSKLIGFIEDGKDLKMQDVIDRIKEI